MNVRDQKGPQFGVDVLFVCALPEEAAAVREVVADGFLGCPGVAAWAERDDLDRTAYRYGRFIVDEQTSFTVALAELSRMGAEAASLVLGTLVERLKPACLAMTGVCAGHPSKVALGDVIIADPVYHCLQGKQTLRGLQPDIRTYEPDSLWVRAASRLTVEDLSRFARPTAEEGHLWLLSCLADGMDPRDRVERVRYLPNEDWRSALEALEAEGLISSDTAGLRLTKAGLARIRHHRLLYPDGPASLPFEVVVGAIASGPYVDDSNPWSGLEWGGVRKVIGYEMEAISFGSAARDLGLSYWIVAKGVMDYASGKSDSHKEFAAHASAEVAWKFLVERCRDQPQSVLRSVARAPSSVPTALPQSNLQDVGNQFVGREAQRQICVEHLEHAGHRLITIVGPPGSGKTRLAIEVANQVRALFSDRVYVVDLSVVSDPDLVFATITQSLKIEAGDPLIDSLRELFRDAPSLIVLDNFDRVAAAGSRVTELMQAVPELRLLVTNDGPLRQGPEHVVEVGTLTLEESEELFVARAGSRPTGLVAEGAVKELCALLDGLPLAVELVAAHAALFTPQELLRKVRQTVHVNSLRSLKQDDDGRHLSVDSAIQWSFDLLEPEQRDLFVRLAVFDDGWTADAAEKVLEHHRHDPDPMTRLRQRRLIHVVDPEAAHPRFRMLSPLRAFGQQLLLHRSDRDQLLDRHANYFFNFVCSRRDELNGDAKARVLGEMAADHANIHAALDHLVKSGDARRSLAMAASLDTYWWSRAYAAGVARLAAVLALGLPDSADSEVLQWRAEACLAAGKLALRRFELTDARRHFAEAQVLARVIGRPDLEALGLERESLVDIEQGQYDAAEAKLRSAYTIHDGLGPKADAHAADCLDDLGTVASEKRQDIKAEDLFWRAIRRYPNSDDHQAEAWVRIDLAQNWLLRNDPTEARRHAEYASQIGRDTGDPGLMMWADHLLGLIHLSDSTAIDDPRHDEARVRLTQSLQRALLLGNMRARFRALEAFVVLAIAVGRPVEALTLEAAIRLRRERIGLPRSKTEQRLMQPALVQVKAHLSTMAQRRAADDGALLHWDVTTQFARGI